MNNDEIKQTAASAESETAHANGDASGSATKSVPKPRPASKPKTGNAGAKKADNDTVHASTAQSSEVKQKPNPAKAKNGEKKPSTAMPPMPSSKPAHRAIPYILFGVAAFVAICLLINLFCNFNNKCASDPTQHWMGSVGYGICYALFGLFGAAVFILPLLLLNLAIYWKAYVDNKLVLEKVLISLFLLFSMSMLIHSFSFIRLPDDQWQKTASELMALGAQMRGGGVLGGGLGYFFAQHMNVLGAIIVGLFLTVISGFFFLGMTPQYLWKRLRALKKEKAPKSESETDSKKASENKKKEKVSEAPIEEAPKKREKHPARREGSNGENADGEDELAPMPMPILDASEDTPVNNLYVPADIGREMRGGATIRRPMPTQNGQRPVSAPNGQRPMPSGKPPIPPNPNAQINTPPKDSIEAVFPRSAAETKNVKRAQRDDQNFELGKIFIDLDDRKPTPKKHAPLPPEAPLPTGVNGARPAPRTEAGNPAPRTASQGARAQGSTAPQRPVASTPLPATVNGKPTITMRPATAPAGARPSPAPTTPTAPRGNGQKPVFRPSEKPSSTDFGLSSEEFEKREANAQTIARATSAKTAAAKTPSGKKPAPAKSADAKTVDAKQTASAKKPTAAESSEKAYIFPPISYLHPSEPMTAENHSEIKANMEKLFATLSDFNVRINEITYSCGPTVTRYEIYPSAGVRVRTITNLADDIALAFAVQSVRMEAIPGKSAIGVEVPNTTRQTVYLRELLESNAFVEKPSKLTAGLGADVAGAPLLFDIAKMPHLLVAGATGMGKSVCINCIIMSILFKARPDQVKLILVDPKKVEFSLYKGIPHLMAPIIVTPKDAAGALQAAVLEMEDRFTKIQDVGVSNIEGYNKAADKDPDLPHMPHIVIIIDELADLMLTARDEVEDSICRLAQKARAAGMHIIVGTQRPSVDVVTGLIKSNIPSRVACTVASQVDSRTILDIAGAEKLLGKGDMLFAPVGAMKPTRVQGAFVSDAEVEKICEFIRATNGTAVYNDAFTSKMKEYSAMCGNKKNKGGDGETVSLPGESGDNKYVDAIRISIEENRVSTSLLQRKLGIGYSRAAKIIDRMEEEGLVSKPDGSKPRNILISAEQFIERYIEGNAGAESPEDEE